MQVKLTNPASPYAASPVIATFAPSAPSLAFSGIVPDAMVNLTGFAVIPTTITNSTRTKVIDHVTHVLLDKLFAQSQLFAKSMCKPQQNIHKETGYGKLLT